MNIKDLIFFSILLIFVLIGAWRGWMSQALNFLGLSSTILAMIKFGPMIGAALPLGGPGEAVRSELGALIAMVFSMTLGHQCVLLHRYLFPRKGPQPAHRTLGALFGIASGFLVLMVFALLIDASMYREQLWWKGTLAEDIAMTLISALKFLLI